MPADIHIRDATFAFGAEPALSGINLSVHPGELFGIIGPDGAGKTTLIRMMASLLLPDRGEVEVLGHSSRTGYAQIRRQIGYVPGRFSLYGELSVEENLQFSAALFGKSPEENASLIRHIYAHLQPFRKRLAKQLSGGMKQKLSLCCALVHRPRLLLLDEPTRGVDPVSRVEFWTILQELKQEGITTIVSTPYMDEASRCDRIALLQQGQLLSVDSPRGLRNGFQQQLFAIRSSADTYTLLQLLRQWPFTANVYASGPSIHFIPREPVEETAILRYLRDAGYAAVEVHPVEPAVEDCFMALTETPETYG